MPKCIVADEACLNVVRKLLDERPMWLRSTLMYRFAASPVAEKLMNSAYRMRVAASKLCYSCLGGLEIDYLRSLDMDASVHLYLHASALYTYALSCVQEVRGVVPCASLGLIPG
jgi:hypothetical protein